MKFYAHIYNSISEEISVVIVGDDKIRYATTKIMFTNTLCMSLSFPLCSHISTCWWEIVIFARDLVEWCCRRNFATATRHQDRRTGFIQSLLLNCNNNKSVFSFLRQLTTWHCSHLLLNAVLLCALLLRRPAAAAVDRYSLPAGPTAATPHAADAVDR